MIAVIKLAGDLYVAVCVGIFVAGISCGLAIARILRTVRGGE